MLQLVLMQLTNGSGIKGYYYSMDKNNWNFSASNSYTFSGLANGTHTFYVFATDYADNNSEDKMFKKQ